MNGQSRVVNFYDISKRKLADLVNRQSARIRELERHAHMTTDLLLAITQNPDAFKVTEEGKATIERGALLAVKKNTTLHVKRDGETIHLSHTPPEAQPQIETPRIIMPSGVH